MWRRRGVQGRSVDIGMKCLRWLRMGRLRALFATFTSAWRQYAEYNRLGGNYWTVTSYMAIYLCCRPNQPIREEHIPRNGHARRRDTSIGQADNGELMQLPTS